VSRPTSPRLDLEHALEWAKRQGFGSLRRSTATTRRRGDEVFEVRTFAAEFDFPDFASLLDERARLYGIPLVTTWGNVRQWRVRGVLAHTAELIAECFDTSPIRIWGEEWTAVVGPELEFDVDLDEEMVDG
jgi:hypothetical protein